MSDKIQIPPFCVSFEVREGQTVLVGDGFNCYNLTMAANALERAARNLRHIRDEREREHAKAQAR